MLIYTKRIEKMRWRSKLHGSESCRFCHLVDFFQCLMLGSRLLLRKFNTMQLSINNPQSCRGLLKNCICTRTCHINVQWKNRLKKTKAKWELNKGRFEETLYTITVTVEWSVAFLKWTWCFSQFSKKQKKNFREMFELVACKNFAVFTW